MQSNQIKIPTLVERAIGSWEVHLPVEQKRDLPARISFLLNDESIPYSGKLRLCRKQLIVVLIGLYNDLYSQPGWEDLLFTGERPINDEPDTEQEGELTKFDAFTKNAERGISACFELTRDVVLPQPAVQAQRPTAGDARKIVPPDEFEQRVEMVNRQLDDPVYQARFADQLSPVQEFIAGQMNKGRRHGQWKSDLPCDEALEVLKRQYHLAGWSLLIIPQPSPSKGGSLSWMRRR